MRTATVTADQAIARGMAQADHGPAFREGTCKIQVEALFGVPSAGNPDATAGWEHGVKLRHNPPADLAHIPRGAILWWTGGSHGHGHVAVALGHGMCLTTDLGRVGFWNVRPIADVHRVWGLRFVGWSEDLEGVRVYSPPFHSLVRTTLAAKPGPDRYAAMQYLAKHGSPQARKHAAAWLRAEDQKRASLAHLAALAAK